MAVYKLNSKKKSKSQKNVKKIVGFTFMIVASLLFFCLVGISAPLQTFSMGVFGIFGFPLCVVLFVVGLALVNNRRYVMPLRYTICLFLAVFFLLCIIQLICVGGSTLAGGGKISFGDYLAKNYLQKVTAGGIVIGLFTTIFLYATTIWGAYIISILGFVISVALMIDSLNFLKKEKNEKEPVSVQIRDEKKELSQKTFQQKQIENQTSTIGMAQKNQQQEIPNVVLGGNLQEEKEKEILQRKTQEEKKPLTARQILGLDKKRNYAYEFDSEKQESLKQQSLERQNVVSETKNEPTKPKSLKEIILTPPQVDLDEYFKDVKKESNVPSKSEVEKNLESLKNDENSPSEIFHEDEFKVETSPFIRRSLPEEKPNELVARADDILRSAIEEEKQENPDIFENLENDKESFSPLDNLPERDNSGSFSRNTNFENDDETDDFSINSNDDSSSNVLNTDNDNEKIVNNFDRRTESFSRDRNFDSMNRNSFENNRNFSRDRDAFNQSLREREERTLSQEDKDARGQFRNEFDKMNIRNGSLAREVEPIPEEQEEINEPYVYEKPSLDLITTQSVDLSTLNEDVAEKRVMLENTLETFGVPAKVQGVVVGPAVTRYELEMPQGISVQKIKSRADDIALSLAAEGTIRIEAPIPGKSVVGIEVPNSSIATISLKDVLASREFQQASSPLTFALGKDITGKTICADMRKLTHLLVAGSTGSGKSVCLNSIILSIIYKASPEEVKIILIDPKRVEFASYEGLPHLIMPQIVCDTQKAIHTLDWAVNEMERRFEVLRVARVREISEFNQSPDVVSGKIKKMPYLVIIVDELADLMMTGKKEVEEKVCRLAQKARAAGIHLILATQRPSVDVITGLIKSNFPSRISFAVTSAVDSMTILDRVGAEKLLGKGDMFYFPNGAKDPFRVQGCFLTTNEINNIVDFCRDNNKPIFDPEIEKQINNPNKGNGNGPGYNNEMDELLPQALKVSIDCGQASATMLRRRFSIGYPRAGKIIDQMEAAGYISCADGPKGRTVYITKEEFEQLFGDID